MSHSFAAFYPVHRYQRTRQSHHNLEDSSSVDTFFADAAPDGRLTIGHVGCTSEQDAASSSPSVMTTRLPVDGQGVAQR